MTANLGAAAHLLTFTGEGHGAMFASSCVRDASIAVLIEAQQSEATNCDPDPPAPRPEWFDELALPAEFVPIDLLGAEELLGLDPATMYSASYVSGSATAGDDLVAALESGGWKPAQRLPMEIEGASDGEQIILLGSGKTAAALVLGPATLALSDLTAFAGLVPDGRSLIVLIAIQ